METTATFPPNDRADFAPSSGAEHLTGTAARAGTPSGDQAAQTVRRRLWLLLALATAAKLYCALTTLGTNDVVSFHAFGQTLNANGLVETYRIQPLFNHPPLVGWYLQAICRLTAPTFAWFPFWLRLPGILADAGSAALLLGLTRTPGFARPAWACACYVLSPVSFMIAGFHGNTDPVVTFFLLAAAISIQQGRSLRGALLLAGSLQIKVIGIVLLPIFLWCWWRQRRLAPALGVLGGVCLLGWWQPLTQAPGPFFSHVLGYGSYWGIWGVTFWLRHSGVASFDAIKCHDLNPSCLFVGTVLKAAIMAGVTWLGWRTRRQLPGNLIPALAFGWAIFFVLSPGVCVQYLVWLAPFIFLCDVRWYVLLTAASSVYLFIFYTLTSHEFPWYYANANASPTGFLNSDCWSLWVWAACAYGFALLPRFLRGSALPARRPSPEDGGWLLHWPVVTPRPAGEVASGVAGGGAPVRTIAGAWES